MMAARKFRDNHGRTLRRRGEGNNNNNNNKDANASQPSSPRSARTVQPRLARPGRSPVPDVYAQYTMNRRGVRRTQWREQGSWVESDADDEESHEGCEIPEDGENAPEEAGDGAAENGGQNNDRHQEEKQDGEQQAPEEGNDDGKNDGGEKAPDGDGERGLRWEAEEAAMRARTSQRVEAWLSNVGNSTPLLHPEAAPSPDAVTDNGEDSDNDSEGGVPININTLRQAAPAPNRNVLMPRRGGPTNINNRRDEVAPAPNPNVLMPRGGYPNLPLAEGTRYRTRSVTRAAAAAAQAAATTLAPGQGYVAVPVAERHAAQLSFMADEDELEDEE